MIMISWFFENIKKNLNISKKEEFNIVERFFVIIDCFYFFYIVWVWCVVDGFIFLIFFFMRFYESCFFVNINGWGCRRLSDDFIYIFSLI